MTTGVKHGEGKHAYVQYIWRYKVKVKPFLCLTKYYAMKTYGGVDV
jgi:hypothetical protein